MVLEWRVMALMRVWWLLWFGVCAGIVIWWFCSGVQRRLGFGVVDWVGWMDGVWGFLLLCGYPFALGGEEGAFFVHCVCCFILR